MPLHKPLWSLAAQMGPVSLDSFPVEPGIQLSQSPPTPPSTFHFQNLLTPASLSFIALAVYAF